MQEVFRTQDIVEVSFVKSLLDAAGIRYFVFGEHVATLFGNMIGDDISSCRFMVSEEDADAALDVLEDAGLVEAYEENQ